MFTAVSVRSYALSLIESYCYFILRTVLALSKPRTHVCNPQPPPVNPYINTQVVKLENITKIPPSFSTFGCTRGIKGRSIELDRRWLLHMRVSTNASGLGFATRSAVFDGFLLALIRSLILLMCNQARSLILLHRRLCLIHIKKRELEVIVIQTESLRTIKAGNGCENEGKIHFGVNFEKFGGPEQTQFHPAYITHG
ncbi:hypothetical protein HanXRQr2_Chr16g0770281 [Helianthus annuus]|uniref:Uncharacterized protein n=1 Tax=Helianthus annuus TaxID=4232 RepID=A0A251S416_HELAN|nr:hypothetical protein HanXRQr2_Chr16g0770281 [Helianthus annuus]KAJ0822979.1 hypothetical protein HanPSC8_Chr16g0738351 [Helianthus annuus]